MKPRTVTFRGSASRLGSRHTVYIPITGSPLREVARMLMERGSPADCAQAARLQAAAEYIDAAAEYLRANPFGSEDE